MRYPIVFLDADDTLLDFDRAETCAVRETLLALGLSADEEMLRNYKAINRSLWEALERGEESKETLLLKRFALLFERYGVQGNPETVNRDYHARLAQKAFTVEGAEALCRTLHRSGRKLYVLTNGTADIQRRRMADSGLAAFLNGHFISEDMGAQKPSAAYFDAVFERLGQPDRRDCILLGDSQTSDMAGAKNYGIAACWFNPGGQARRGDWDYEIARLEQFPDILEGGSTHD